MLKKLLLAGIMFISQFVWAKDIVLITPFADYATGTETGENESAVSYGKRTALKIKECLEKIYFRNFISFEYREAENGESVSSSLEAEKLSAEYKSDFVLYGFIKESQKILSAELKLYDAGKRQVIKQFYAMDEKREFERFVEVLSIHIKDYFYEKAGMDNFEENEAQRDFEIKFMFSPGYYFICEENWNKVLYSVFCADTGFEIIPGGKVLCIYDKEWNLSMRPQISYRYALGNKKYYESYLNSVSFCVPVLVNLYFSDINKVSMGAGLFYEAGFLSFKKKYEEKKMYFENQGGVSLNLLYSMKTGNKTSVFTEIEGNLYFTRNSFNTVKIKLGIERSLYKKGVKE